MLEAGGEQFRRHGIPCGEGPVIQQTEILLEGADPLADGVALVLAVVGAVDPEGVVEHLLHLIGQVAPDVAPRPLRGLFVGAGAQRIGEIAGQDVVRQALTALLCVGGLARQHEHEEQCGDGKILVAGGAQEGAEVFALDLRCREGGGAHRAGELFDLEAVHVHQPDLPGRLDQDVAGIEIADQDAVLVQEADLLEQGQAQLHAVPLFPAGEGLKEQGFDEQAALQFMAGGQRHQKAHELAG